MNRTADSYDVVSRLFEIANAGKRTWGLGAWFDVHRPAVQRLVEQANASIYSIYEDPELMAFVAKLAENRARALAIQRSQVGRGGLDLNDPELVALGISFAEALGSAPLLMLDRAAAYAYGRASPAGVRGDALGDAIRDTNLLVAIQAAERTKRSGKRYGTLQEDVERFRERLEGLVDAGYNAPWVQPFLAEMGWGGAAAGQPQRLASLYEEAAALAATRPEHFADKLPNILGALRDLPGQKFYREPPRGAAPRRWGPHDLDAIEVDLKQVKRRLEMQAPTALASAQGSQTEEDAKIDLRAAFEDRDVAAFKDQLLFLNFSGKDAIDNHEAMRLRYLLNVPEALVKRAVRASLGHGGRGVFVEDFLKALWADLDATRAKSRGDATFKAKLAKAMQTDEVRRFVENARISEYEALEKARAYEALAKTGAAAQWQARSYRRDAQKATEYRRSVEQRSVEGKV